MKISKLHYFAFIFSGFIFFACESSDDPEPQLLLQTVGFEGKLPDGQTVSFPSEYEADSEPIFFSFRTDADPGGVVYQGNVATHYMHLNDLTRDFKISLRLPEFKWSEVADERFNSRAVYEEVYSYQKVKEILSIGEKKINVVDFDFDREDYGAVPDFIKVYYASPGNSFSYESSLYNPFFHEGKFEAPNDNYFRVTRQQEGFYKDESGEDKKLLLVEIELKLDMYEILNVEGIVRREPIEGRLILAFKEFIPDWAE